MRYLHEISILEKDKQILQGTSARTPGRMGLGYHYFDFDTAKLYMEQTVKFIKQYPDCFLGSSESQSYLQNGRYFIVKDSLVGHQDLMATFDRISHEFEGMTSKDSSANVFGTTHLHRSLRME